MSVGRTLVGSALAAGLILGLAACNGDGDTPQSADTPAPSSPASSTATSPTPIPVDPAAAAKAKILADYKVYIATRTRGFLSNDPTFAYEGTMTGNALRSQKAVMTGAHTIGTTYTGTTTFLKARIVSVNLRTKPATAQVQACLVDGLAWTSKSGKKQGGVKQQIATDDQMQLIAGTWKTSETKTLDKGAAGCAG